MQETLLGLAARRYLKVLTSLRGLGLRGYANSITSKKRLRFPEEPASSCKVMLIKQKL